MQDDVAVAGWYDHGNLGDESYRKALPALLPGVPFRFMDIGKVKPSDGRLIFGGGDIARANTIACAAKAQGPRVILSAGLSSCDCVKDIPSTFCSAFLRDSASVAKLNGMMPVQLMPDLAFSLQGDAARGSSLVKSIFANANADLYNRVAIVVLNSYLIVGRPTNAAELAFLRFSYEFAAAIDTMPMSFLFLPFGQEPPQTDMVPNYWVASRCKYWRKNVVSEPLSLQDTLDVIAAADFSISMRLHAAIFACAVGTPFLDIHHHNKTLHLLRTYGLDDWTVPYWRFDHTVLSDAVALIAAGNPKERLRLLGDKLREELSRLPELILPALGL